MILSQGTSRGACCGLCDFVAQLIGHSQSRRGKARVLITHRSPRWTGADTVSLRTVVLLGSGWSLKSAAWINGTFPEAVSDDMLLLEPMTGRPPAPHLERGKPNTQYGAFTRTRRHAQRADHIEPRAGPARCGRHHRFGGQSAACSSGTDRLRRQARLCRPTWRWRCSGK